MESTAKAMSQGTQTIFIGNFFLSLLLTVSLQYVWELISAQQLVILFPLMKVSIPSNAYIFFQQLMMVAAVEVIPTDLIYSKVSNVEGQPLSASFEEVGFEHHLIMNNFGTFGFILAILPFFYAFQFIISLCTVSKFIQRLSGYLYSKLYYGSLLRMIIQSYIICLICCLLNLRVLNFT